MLAACNVHAHSADVLKISLLHLYTVTKQAIGAGQAVRNVKDGSPCKQSLIRAVLRFSIDLVGVGLAYVYVCMMRVMQASV